MYRIFFNVPKLYARIWYPLWFGFLGSLIMSLTLYHWDLFKKPSSYYVLSLARWAPFVSMIPVHLFMLFRLRRRLQRADYCLCLKCGYDLRATASPGVCPECGSDFDHEGLRRDWRFYTRRRGLLDRF